MKLALPTSTPVSTRVWSPQQEEIFREIEKGSANLLIEAVAGSGKTTTLVEACGRAAGTVAFCAYNKAIAEEIKVRVRGHPHVTAGTFHSFGFAAWRGHCGGMKMKVDGNKVQDICELLNVPWNLRGTVKQLVAYLKQGIVDPRETERFQQAADEIIDFRDLAAELSDKQIPELVRFARGVLAASNTMALPSDNGIVIDFEDMMYMPLLMNARFPQFDFVFVDEAQDSNHARRITATRMLKPHGRIVAVGDRHQAIYGFTGADSDAMDLIKEHHACKELPLTVTYRCATEIVQRARTLVSHITARDGAPAGFVRTVDEDVFWRGDLPDEPDRADPPAEWERLSKTDAILCRNTRPLISLAFELIRRDIPCHVEGREIGQGLIAIVRKNADDWTRVPDIRDNVRDYMEREVQKLLSKQREVQAAQIEDKCETIFVILSNLKETDTLASVVRKIQSLFGDTEAGRPSPNLTLSTIHKSKGREWERVFFWGRNRYCPSKYARAPWQLEQERNLEYVAITRAKYELVEVELL